MAFKPKSISGGSGDVVGPISAIDERIAVFDGITGKLIKDGGKTIAETLADAKVGVDSVATPDYLGNAAGDGALRVDSTLDYTDGGNFITIGLDSTLKSNYDAANTHIGESGASHTYIDQSVISGATPTFTNTNFRSNR